MRVMVLVKATKDSEAGIMPSTELLEAMGEYNEALVDAGILAGDFGGLRPSSKGKRVAFDGSNRAVIDGPFAETKEVVAGFWLWEVKCMAEAVEWVKRCPNPMLGPSEIEIWPLFEMADFGEVLTPGVAELHNRTRERRPTAEAIAPGYDYCSETVQWMERKQWQLGHFAEGTPVPTNPRRQSFSISTMCSLWSAKAT